MSGLTIGLIVWGVLTGFLILLMIYRATLVNHEDDQLFLSSGESQMARDQAEVVAKLNKVEPLIKAMAWASGLLLISLGGFWFYQSLQTASSL